MPSAIGRSKRTPSLRQIRRRQVDGDAPVRHPQAAVDDRGAHAILALLHDGFGQADDREARQAAAEVDFDAHERRFHAVLRTAQYRRPSPSLASCSDARGCAARECRTLLRLRGAAVSGRSPALRGALPALRASRACGAGRPPGRRIPAARPGRGAPAPDCSTALKLSSRSRRSALRPGGTAAASRRARSSMKRASMDRQCREMHLGAEARRASRWPWRAPSLSAVARKRRTSAVRRSPTRTTAAPF